MSDILVQLLCVSSFLTYLRCTVDVLDGENRPQTVQENFREGRYELCCGHQHVYTVTPAGREQTVLGAAELEERERFPPESRVL